MKPIRILVDSFADAGLPNAQMGNAREIIQRLDENEFHVTTFVLGQPDPQIAKRKNTRLIQLPQRRQTVRILSEFLFGPHEVLFYMKSAPASRWYLKLRERWHDQRVTIGTIESQCNLSDKPDIAPEALELWEQTILRCDYLYSNSESVKRSLKRHYGLNSEVIPTGTDTRFFAPDWHRPPNPRPRVLFVGSLVRLKRPDLVLTAAARFRGAEFRIVGQGRMKDEIKARIEREKLGNVFMSGVLGAEQLRQEYRQADIFFFPSEFEGSPKVIVEAAACGLPVIARDCYQPETVVHDRTGLLGATDDDLISHLEFLLSKPDVRSKLGDAGRRHSMKFDWDGIATQWAQTFEELAPSRRLRRAS